MQGQHPRARLAEEQTLKTLAMRRAIATMPTHRCAHHERQLHLPVVHACELRGVVHPLIRGKSEEVAEHDLGHRMVARQCEPIAEPDDGRLADGRVAHPARVGVAQASGDLERTSVRRFDVLAEHDRARIARQQRIQFPADRRDHALARECGRLPRALPLHARGGFEVSEGRCLCALDRLFDPHID